MSNRLPIAAWCFRSSSWWDSRTLGECHRASARPCSCARAAATAACAFWQLPGIFGFALPRSESLPVLTPRVGQRHRSASGDVMFTPRPIANRTLEVGLTVIKESMQQLTDKPGFGFPGRARVRAVASPSHCGGPSISPPSPALQSDTSSPPGRCLACRPRQTLLPRKRLAVFQVCKVQRLQNSP